MNEILKLDHTQLVALIATLVPAPTKEKIGSIMESELLANPHNDSYKPKRRGDVEIIATLRVRDALAIVDEVYMQTMTKHDETIGGLRR